MIALAEVLIGEGLGARIGSSDLDGVTRALLKFLGKLGGIRPIREGDAQFTVHDRLVVVRGWSGGDVAGERIEGLGADEFLSGAGLCVADDLHRDICFATTGRQVQHDRLANVGFGAIRVGLSGIIVRGRQEHFARAFGGAAVDDVLPHQRRMRSPPRGRVGKAVHYPISLFRRPAGRGQCWSPRAFSLRLGGAGLDPVWRCATPRPRLRIHRAQCTKSAPNRGETGRSQRSRPSG